MQHWIVLLLVIIIGIETYLLLSADEPLCVRKDYGYVTDVPASQYTNANMALVHSTSIGQAPLGDPAYWTGTGSPITQGQYGFYNVQNRDELNKFAAQLPQYNEWLPGAQCTVVQ